MKKELLGGRLSHFSTSSRMMVGARRCAPALSFAVILAATGAFAAEWRIEPRLNVQETFTDNIELASDGGEADLITSVAPGVSINGQGGRVGLNLDYSLTKLMYLDKTSRDEFRNGLTASGNIEAVKQRVFIEAQASVSQQTISNTGAVSATGLSDSRNRTTVQTYNVTPIVRHHFGNWAESEARNFISLTRSGAAGVSDTRTNGFTTSVTSGSRFTSLKWGLSLASDKTSRSGDAPANTRDSANANAEYVFSPQISLTGNIGLERIDDGTLTNKPKGAIWSVGTRLRPGPRTSLNLDYGDRYDTKDLTGDLTYEVSPRTTITASFTESLQTTQGQQGSNLTFVGTDDDGNLVDTRTGLPFNAADSAFGLTDNTFRQERLQAQVSSTRGRNTYFISAFDEDRKTDATGINENSFGTTLSWQRQLTRKADGSMNFSYRFNDFGTADSREDSFISFAAQLSYRIFRTAQGTVSYSLTQRDSSIKTNDLTENSVTISFRQTF